MNLDKAQPKPVPVIGNDDRYDQYYLQSFVRIKSYVNDETGGGQVH